MFPNGAGRMTYVGISGAWCLDANWEKGQPKGYVRWIWHDGQIYRGMIKNGKLNGRGLLLMGEVCKANSVQHGQFKNNLLKIGKVKIESEV